jgi:hypothetical protein
MSSPLDAPSLPVDTQDEKNVLPVSPSNESPPAWVEKAEDGRSSLHLRQPPARSAFASVCVVAACTSSMMMNVAMGPAAAIDLPYAGKNLNIQKDKLQWILNAYAISSVGISPSGVSSSPPHLPQRHVSFLYAAGSQIFMAEN